MTDTNTDDEQSVAKLQAALRAERESHRATKTALESTKAELADTSGRLKIAIDASPVNVTEFIAAATTAATTAATAEQQAKIAELQTALDTEKKGSADLLGKLHRRTVDEEVREAARAAHIREEAMADALLIGSLELRVVDGLVQTEGGASVEEWLDSCKSTRGFWWPLSKGAGATRGSMGDGAKVFTGSNPWDPKSFNLTEQGRMVQNQPELAKQLQAQVLQ